MISNMLHLMSKSRFQYARIMIMTLMLAIGGTLAGMMVSTDALAAAKTYSSKGSTENPRHVLERCRLKKVEVVDGVTMCIYRSQSGKKVTMSAEDPSAGCQKQFKCKR